MIYSDLQDQAPSPGDALAFTWMSSWQGPPNVVTGEVVSVELEESPDDGARVLEYRKESSRRVGSDGKPESLDLHGDGFAVASNEPEPPHFALVFRETDEKGELGERLGVDIPYRVYPDGTPPVDHWETLTKGCLLRLAAGPLISTREVLYTTEEEEEAIL